MLRIFSLVFFLSVSFAAGAAPMPSYSEMYVYDNQDCYEIDQTDKQEVKIADPFKVINKQIFYFNNMIDMIILMPFNQIYITAVPKMGRKYVANFMSNIAEPLNILNSIFQGNFAQAKISFGRFATNTLMGFGGIVDVASKLNLKYRSEDFGQTMASYKMPSGPYLVAPLMGPTNVRDLSGKIVDYFLDPFNYLLKRKERYAVDVVWILQKRSDGDSVIKMVRQSLDPYETAKQMYIQYRKNQIDSN